MSRKPFWKIFVERLAIAAALVLVTYNAAGYSYYHWVFANPFEGFQTTMGGLKVLLGVILVVGYLILMYATWRAKGPVGILIMFAVLGAFVYFAWTTGYVDFRDPNISTIIVQILVTVALAVGSTWSIFWRRITGQVSVEDPDTEMAD